MVVGCVPYKVQSKVRLRVRRQNRMYKTGVKDEVEGRGERRIVKEGGERRRTVRRGCCVCTKKVWRKFGVEVWRQIKMRKNRER